MKTIAVRADDMTAQDAQDSVNYLLHLTCTFLGTSRQFRLDWGEVAGPLRDLRGWKALGFKSWKQFCKTKLAISKRQADDMIRAAKVGKRIADVGGIPPTSALPTSQLLALAGLDERELKTALAATGDKRTAAQIEEFVAGLSDAEAYQTGEKSAAGAGETITFERDRQGKWKIVRWQEKLFDKCRAWEVRDNEPRWGQAAKLVQKLTSLINAIVGPEPPRVKAKPTPRHTRLVG